MQFATCIKVNKSYTRNAADGNRGKLIRNWDVRLNQWITDCDALIKWWLGYTLEDRGNLFRFPVWEEDFISFKDYRPILVLTQPPVYWVKVLLLGEKRHEREVAHQYPSCAKVKNIWSYISVPSNAFMVQEQVYCRTKTNVWCGDVLKWC
jgi:hypothetical protein